MKIQTLALFVATVLTVGCAVRQGPRTDAGPTPQTPKATGVGAPSEPTTATVATDWGEIPGLENIYFDTDRSELSESARGTLKRNGAVLRVLAKEVPGLEVQIQGHCDERATLEYNLALGQRRSNVVKEYYRALGLGKIPLVTISYGEERPVCHESEEGCWQQNRRGVTVVRAKAAKTVPLDKLSPLKGK